ncbi:cyclic pyranopterin monophosphate synthase MoaC [Paenibacillus sp. GCM10027626]|uniref:cyclic pyranopterin monophosphate synthase MoaC n=1 Tax=Paenibacillus sp. GCM10027626 TaxID=3273411 RepID=UPI00363BA95D
MTGFSHFNEQGRATMVDISFKNESVRTAAAQSQVMVNAHIYRQLMDGTNKKGDVFAVAQVAGIMAAKNTAQFIPMCHPILLTGSNIEFRWEVDEKQDRYIIYIRSEVKTKGPTGVEMEALTAAAVSALTIYDMCKAAGKEIIIGPTLLVSKTGGKNGDYLRIDSESSF